MGMTNNLGGIETYLINYYRNIDRSRIQFDFTNIYDSDLCFQQEMESYGAKIYKVFNYYKHPIKYLKQVKKIIKDNDYKIVHCNMNSAVMLYPLIAAKLGGAKVIISHSHNSSSDKGFLKTILHNINKHFIPLFSNTYFACSDKAGKWFYNKKILNSDKYFVINNAIDTKKFAYNLNSRVKKRQELGINDSTIVIGHVGRFNKQKNHNFLVDVFYKFHKKNPDSLLLLVGDGPLMSEIKNKVQLLKLSDCVNILGKRNDANELYQAMDIFALPSIYEGLPLVGVEAQVSGVKCIFSTNITKEVKLSTQTLFLPLDVDKWCDEIKKLEKTKHKRVTLKACNFDIIVESKKICGLYEELIKKC